MTGPAPASEVEIESRDSVLSIVLNRPDRKNSLNPVAVRTIVAALEEAATEDSLRVISITGRGPDFCSGADWIASNAGGASRPRTGSVQRRTALQAHRMIDLLMEIQLPVVCTVRGWAAGLGCQIALASDFAVASDTSRFWEPFVSRGFTPDSGATWMVPRSDRCGPRQGVPPTRARTVGGGGCRLRAHLPVRSGSRIGGGRLPIDHRVVGRGHRGHRADETVHQSLAGHRS
jgi:hypothetical protein